MAGMLQYGIMKGVGNEWLKQSDESRKAQLQEIRDNRLAELEQGNIKLRGKLTSEENVRKEGVLAEAADLTRQHETGRDTAKFEHETALQEAEIAAKGPVTTTTSAGAGTDYWDPESKTWKKVRDQPKTFAPTSGSAALAKWEQEKVIRMDAAKTASDRKALHDEWLSLAYDEIDNPEFPGMGMKIKRRRQETPDWIEWHNSQVQPEYRLQPNDPRYMQGDPGALYEYYMGTAEAKKPGMKEKLIEKLRSEHKWWGGPEGYTPSRGGAGGDQVQQQFGGKSNFVEMSSQNQPAITEPYEKKEAPSVPDAADVIPSGMLEQAQQATGERKVQQSGGMTAMVASSTAKKIKAAQDELDKLGDRRDRAAANKRKRLKEEIAALQKLMD